MKKILMSVAYAIFVSSNCVWLGAAQTRLTADQVLSIAATSIPAVWCIGIALYKSPCQDDCKFGYCREMIGIFGSVFALDSAYKIYSWYWNTSTCGKCAESIQIAQTSSEK